jgi:HD-GYP domain-containing protein (c-di-GMP phosphodiesterase class II)
VAQLSVAIGERVGVTGSDLARLRVAGLLHDVGKLGIANAILEKADELDGDERSELPSHVQVGHSILLAAELPREADWVLHHHERYDGTGYPSGKRGEDIPLGSRIVAVADAFEAMTADRPYRSRLSTAEALDELRRQAGAQFDERCVEALVRALADARDGEPPAGSGWEARKSA